MVKTMGLRWRGWARAGWVSTGLLCLVGGCGPALETATTEPETAPAVHAGVTPIPPAVTAPDAAPPLSSPYQRHHIGFPAQGYTVQTTAPVVPENDLAPYTYSIAPDHTLLVQRALGPGESLWGLGGAGEAFNLRGQHAHIGPGASAPVLLSSEGHGLFINHRGRLHFDAGASDPDTLRIAIPDQGVELFTFSGTLHELLDIFSGLIGRPPAWPDWIYRPWLGRSVFFGSHEVTRALRRFEEAGLDLGAVILEEWKASDDAWQLDRSRFPMPLTWIHELSLRDIHVLLQAQESALTADVVRHLKDKGARGLLLEAQNRGPGQETAFRPCEGVADLVLAGSSLHPDPSFACRIKTFRPEAKWPELAQRVRGGIAAGLSGSPFWAEPVGGYYGIPEKNLYIRWLQWATFAPVLSFHAHDHLRAPWHYDAETESVTRFYAGLRTRLLDTLATLGQEAHRTGTPLLRPLMWHYPDDPETHSIGSQFMLGPDLLIAPIVTPNPTRSIYLPEGRWRDAWTEERHEGPVRVVRTYALHHVPLFIREAQWSTYSPLLKEAPVVVQEPIRVERVEEPNIHGVIPPLRQWRDVALTESFRYRITNTTDEPVHLTARCAPQRPVMVQPAAMIRLSLAPGEARELTFEARPDARLFTGTHPIPIEVRQGTALLPVPPAWLVVHPLWETAPPQPGGLTHPGTWDGPDLDLNALEEVDWTWTALPLTTLREDGFLDLTSLPGNAPHQTRFLRARIPSERARRAYLRIGSGDGMTVWLNGRLVYDTAHARNPERGEDRVETVLLAGENEVVVRLRRDLAANLFYFRVE